MDYFQGIKYPTDLQNIKSMCRKNQFFCLTKGILVKVAISLSMTEIKLIWMLSVCLVETGKLLFSHLVSTVTKYLQYTLMFAKTITAQLHYFCSCELSVRSNYTSLSWNIVLGRRSQLWINGHLQVWDP